MKMRKSYGERMSKNRNTVGQLVGILHQFDCNGSFVITKDNLDRLRKVAEMGVKDMGIEPGQPEYENAMAFTKKTLLVGIMAVMSELNMQNCGAYDDFGL